MGVLWFYQSSQGESQIGLLCTSAQRTPPCLSFNEGLSDFLVSPVVKTLSSSAMAVGSIPGQEAKIPHAFQSNIQTSNRSNTVRNSFVVVQSLCHIQLSVTPWTAAHMPPCPSPSPGVCPSWCPLNRGAIQPSHPLTPSSCNFNVWLISRATRVEFVSWVYILFHVLCVKEQ